MAFPLSPANNQTALVNGIVYQWNGTLGAWKRNGSVNSIEVGQLLLNSAQRSTTNGSGTLIVSGGAGITGNVYTGGIYITGSANGITFADGSVQTTGATGIDSYARTTANTNATNITIIQGVDTAQNTRITISEGVDIGQNTRMSIIEGVDATQNTNITNATNAATAAFAQANVTAGGLITANARITIAEGVDLTQNTNITAADAKAQAAFDKANTGFNSSGGTITGDTVVTGNLTVTGTQFYANTVNLTVVDNIITLNSNVTGAPTLSAGIEVNRGSSTNTKLIWSEANTSWEFTNNGTTYEKIAGLTYVQAAFDKANTAEGSVGFAAFDKANSANVLAQAAFNVANSAAIAANSAGSVLISTVDTYTGDGSTVAYTLSVEPATINYTTAVVGGVTQPKSAYSIVGTTLTFTSAPANNQIVEVTTIGTSNTTLYTVNNILSPFLLMGA
jgi:hypothetical protein